MRPFAVGGRALYLPTSSRLHNQRVIGRCGVIVNAEGETCGAVFFEGQDSKRDQHVAQCAQQHAAAIHAYRERTHPEIMRPWDPELESYVSNNRQALLEGKIPMPRG